MFGFVLYFVYIFCVLYFVYIFCVLYFVYIFCVYILHNFLFFFVMVWEHSKQASVLVIFVSIIEVRFSWFCEHKDQQFWKNPMNRHITCTHTCTCTRTHTHTHAYTHTRIHTHTHTHTHAYTHTHIHTQTYMRTHTHTCACTCGDARKHMHAHAHARVYVCTLMVLKFFFIATLRCPFMGIYSIYNLLDDYKNKSCFATHLCMANFKFILNRWYIWEQTIFDV